MIEYFPNQDSSLVTELLQYAKRYVRRQDEIEDVIQDMFLTAIQSGKEIEGDQFLLWGKGFIRNHSAFVARSEGRRRKREEKFGAIEHCSAFEVSVPEKFILQLIPSLRVLCRLINSGLNRQEIMYALDITDTAFRQRLTSIRQKWDAYLREYDLETEVRSPVHLLETGLLRQSLVKSIQQHLPQLDEDIKVIGSHDPDGNLLIFSGKPAHKKRGGGNLL
ncbi:RNA polymerase sigma factor [Arthrospiribacter ruber]|uniref:RNA polymerase sigma-70 region 2 domain-containing protein n=1 Tax=Arthrospiribacter ruber TaxID=2487934 RepID=A0A951J3I7_9BACT|nr:sigma factor [Arthrospiribacter ruber]MBW3470467.1 hypothetical protein [Arthrospiribacter ruber]